MIMFAVYYALSAAWHLSLHEYFIQKGHKFVIINRSAQQKEMDDSIAVISLEN